MFKLRAPHDIKVREAPLTVLLVHVVSVSFGTNHIKLRGGMFMDGGVHNMGILTALMFAEIWNNIKQNMQPRNNSEK